MRAGGNPSGTPEYVSFLRCEAGDNTPWPVCEDCATNLKAKGLKVASLRQIADRLGVEVRWAD